MNHQWWGCDRVERRWRYRGNDHGMRKKARMVGHCKCGGRKRSTRWSIASVVRKTKEKSEKTTGYHNNLRFL